MQLRLKKKKGLDLSSYEFHQEEQDDNLMPIMSLMIILIPMLIGNMAFFKLRAIDALIPSLEPEEKVEKPKSEQNVVVHLKLYDGRLTFDLVDSDDGSNIQRYIYEEGVNKIEDLQYQIEQLRDSYAKLDTCLVEVDRNLSFQWVTHVLGAVKDAFQVKIGEKYEKQLKLVLLTSDSELELPEIWQEQEESGEQPADDEAQPSQ